MKTNKKVFKAVNSKARLTTKKGQIGTMIEREKDYKLHKRKTALKKYENTKKVGRKEKGIKEEKK